MIDFAGSTENSSTPSPLYPRKVQITLALELEVKTPEQDSYIFARSESEGTSTLQIGFLADLFDLLNFEASLGVEKINNFTYDQIAKTLNSGL